MTLELLKVIVQPVCLERDEHGGIVGEKLGETTVLYTLDQVGEFVVALRSEIGRVNAASNGEGRAQMSETPTTEPTEPTVPAPEPEPEPDTGGDDDGGEGGDDDAD